jgi:Na+/H+ antiporter NhaA
LGLREVLGVPALAGVRLAVSFLFIGLAFPEPLRQNQAKLAVLAVAAVSAAVAATILRPRRSDFSPARRR